MVVVEIAADSVRIDGAAVGLMCRKPAAIWPSTGRRCCSLARTAGSSCAAGAGAERIFALIDDMPMRRAEARQPRVIVREPEALG